MRTVGGAGEAQLLKLIAPYLAGEEQGIEVAATEDDAAFWKEGEAFTVASTDMSVEGVHFDLAWMTPEDAGWRALAMALGDLAAKGATRWWCLTSAAVPKTWARDDFLGLCTGISAMARKV